jgi:hypothetical protein
VVATSRHQPFVPGTTGTVAANAPAAATERFVTAASERSAA